MKNGTEHISLRQQITEHFREKILTGELPAESALPPTGEIAKHFGTSVGNAHRALSMLVAQGLISRRLRRGTIVNAQRRELKTVAFLSKESSFYDDYFIRTLATQLDQALMKRGMQMKLMLCRENHFDPVRIKEAAHHNKIQGVILSGVSPDNYDLLQTLQLPFSVYTSSTSYRNRVAGSSKQMFDLFFEGLKTAGCQKIGFIGGIPGPPFTKDELAHGVNTLYDGILNRVDALGGETRPEWWYTKQRNVMRVGRSLDQEVFSAAERIFSLRNRPDGLIVYPDIFNNGVLMALAKYRIRIPEDVHLALYRNKETPTLCPFPAFWVEVSIRKIAEALVKQLVRSFNGEKTSPIEIGFSCYPEENDP